MDLVDICDLWVNLLCLYGHKTDSSILTAITESIKTLNEKENLGKCKKEVMTEDRHFTVC